METQQRVTPVMLNIMFTTLLGLGMKSGWEIQEALLGV